MVKFVINDWIVGQPHNGGESQKTWIVELLEHEGTFFYILTT